MAEVKVPVLPEKAKEGLIAEWHVGEGDTVDEGDDIVEIEAGGETLTLSAPAAGVVTDIYFEDGEEVQPGETVAEIEEE